MFIHSLFSQLSNSNREVNCVSNPRIAIVRPSPSSKEHTVSHAETETTSNCTTWNHSCDGERREPYWSTRWRTEEGQIVQAGREEGERRCLKQFLQGGLGPCGAPPRQRKLPLQRHGADTAKARTAGLRGRVRMWWCMKLYRETGVCLCTSCVPR